MSECNFKRGQRVFVRFCPTNDWEERVFLTHIDGAWNPYLCVHPSYEDQFYTGQVFSCLGYHDAKSIGEKEKEEEEEILKHIKPLISKFENLKKRVDELEKSALQAATFTPPPYAIRGECQCGGEYISTNLGYSICTKCGKKYSVNVQLAGGEE